MLGIVASLTYAQRRELLETTKRLLEAIIEASRYDPYLERLGAENPSHCDGVGYTLLLLEEGERKQLHYFRADRIDCKENLQEAEKNAKRVVRIIEDSKWTSFILLFHTRKASRKEPRGEKHAHPYYASISARHGARQYFFAHNGSIHKDSLARIIGVNPASYTDSEIAFYWLIRRLGYGEKIKDAYSRLKSQVRTALNTLLLDLNEETLIATAYSSPKLDAARLDYYRVYLLEEPGIKAYMSSTIRDIIGRRAKTKTIENTILALSPNSRTIIEEGI